MNSVTTKDNISKSLEFTIHETLAALQKFIQKKDKKKGATIVKNIEQFKNGMNRQESALKLVTYNSVFKNAAFDYGDELRSEDPLITAK